MLLRVSHLNFYRQDRKANDHRNLPHIQIPWPGTAYLLTARYACLFVDLAFPCTCLLHDLAEFAVRRTGSVALLLRSQEQKNKANAKTQESLEELRANSCGQTDTTAQNP